MSRQTVLLSALGVVLLLVAFYFLAWRPKDAEIAELEDQRQVVEDQTQLLAVQVAELEQVRQNAPQIEAQIAAAESVVPRDLSLPSAVRQLQTAADESGIDLVGITPERPATLESETPGIVSIGVSLQFTGGYFQAVDFLRRIEDPAVTPRGFVWQALSATPVEYPTLAVNVTGVMFAVLPAAPVAEPEGPDPAATPVPGATPSPAATASPSPAALQEVGR